MKKQRKSGKKPAVHPRTATSCLAQQLPSVAFFLAGVPFGDCVARDDVTLRGTRPGGFQEQLCTDGVRRAVRQRSCQRGCRYFFRPRLQGITEKNLFPNHCIGHPVSILQYPRAPPACTRLRSLPSLAREPRHHLPELPFALLRPRTNTPHGADTGA